MKFIKLSVIVFFISSYSLSQDIKLSGIWQINSSEINSGWLDSYQFYDNGKFIFNFNQNNSQNRIISFGGYYQLNDENITLFTEYSKEIIGGKLIRSLTQGGSGWEIAGGKVEIIKYHDRIVSNLSIKKCDDSKQIPCLYFDNVIYYKLENDPDKY